MICSTHAQAAAPSMQPVENTEARFNVSVGYLRAFLTVLVVVHHALLAYHPYAPPAATSLVSGPRWWRAFPIVDSQRWEGSSLVIGFNDVFFMSLMFFLSGLFFVGSLRRKGTAGFVRDRALRLGIPFLVGAALLAPLAYYPTYLVTGADPSLAAYASQWMAQGDWPSGPVWFIWVLLAFDCLAAAAFRFFPSLGDRLARLFSHSAAYPTSAFAVMCFLSAAAYLPMVLAFGPMDWVGFGPFTFQTSRIVHYAMYFLAGIGVGAYGIERGLLAATGNLAWRWKRWMAAAFAAFAAAVIIFIASVSAGTQTTGLAALGGLAFVMACATISFSMMALFVRFARRPNKIFESLRNNAYGIYLVHYVFVIWLQYALLNTSLPGVAKGAVVIAGAIALSWITVAALRRVPAVARVI